MHLEMSDPPCAFSYGYSVLAPSNPDTATNATAPGVPEIFSFRRCVWIDSSGSAHRGLCRGYLRLAVTVSGDEIDGIVSCVYSNSFGSRSSSTLPDAGHQWPVSA